ncbi:MAG: sel1 repeat family protein [Methylobacter sp.]|uniref:tetratricopeptide repeat protein n=1 Tax=Methylobacter sp. TaxID=2051955 RepID=UPI0025864D21|nr:tetratricopeptide repeat protein [Methylobacter sp.]MCL7423156.1 sel1 repeat family protein [Methylobacter sp.]
MVRVLVLLSMLMASINIQAAESDIQKMAEQGDALAQAKLGAMYILGREDIERDEQKAAEWMLKAAKQGLIEAEVVMAALYDRGLGVPHNVDMATQWYEKAAAKGHGASLALLGRNDTAKGSVAFNYKTARLSAARQIPTEYAKKILLKK